MSGALDPQDEALAGEYVLGLLEQAERAHIRLRARREPALADAIAAWERRLAPLAAAVAPVPPPRALWDRIAAATEALPADEVAERPRSRRTVVRPWAWPAATAASLALAAALAAFIVLQPAAGPPAFAVLTPINGTPPAFVAQASRDGGVILASLSPQEVPGGRDLELWQLVPGAQKVASLGLLPKGGRTLQLSAPPATGTQFLVSQEPAGGSPTGQPTGPVLYQGVFTGPVDGSAL